MDRPDDLVTIGEAMGLALDRTEAIQDGTGPKPISTGFQGLDDITTGGARPGELWTIAARPAMGKTALAMNVATHAALSGHRVLFVELEMIDADIGARVLAAEGGIPLRRLREGTLTSDEWEDALHTRDAMAEAPMLLWTPRGGTDADGICTLAAHLHDAAPLGLVVVDYLQLLRCPPTLNRERAIGTACTALKGLATSLRLPVLQLAQLNRELERRDDKRPRPSDLRDSGQIEQDADVLLFLYREHVYDQRASEHEAEAIVAKQRNGPTGTVPLEWWGPVTRFTDP